MFRYLPLTLLLLFFSVVVRAQEPKLIIPIGHFLGVGASFSPDGKRIVTSGLDYTAKIWDVATGRLLANLIGHTDTLFGAYYSPDGKKIVTACDDGTAKIWDAVTTIPLVELRGHASSVSVAEFSPDGKKLLTASADATAKIWDVATGRLLFDLKGHTSAIWWAWFSRDGKKIVTSSDDGTAKVWDVATGKMLSDLIGHTSEILYVEISPDGKKVITGSADSTAKIWDAETGKILKEIKDHNAPVRVVHYNPDGKSFVTASDAGNVKIWNEKTGLVIANIKAMSVVNPVPGYSMNGIEVVRAADYTPDGKKLVTVYLDSTIKIWDAFTGKPLSVIKRETINYVNTTSFSRNSETFSLGFADGTAEIYGIVKGNFISSLKGSARHISSFTYSPDGKRFLIASTQSSAKLCDAQTGGLVAVLTGSTTGRGSVIGRFSPDGKKIITYSNNDFSKVWDAVTGIHLWDIKKNNKRTGSPQFSSDGKRIFSASGDSTLNIWDATTGKLLLDIKDQKNRIGYIWVSQNDKRILAYSLRDTLYKIWNAESGEFISQLIDPLKKIASAVLDPSGENVLTLLSDGVVQIRDVKSGSVLLTLKESGKVGSWVSFSKDGKKILAQSQDSTFKIWDAKTGDLLVDMKTKSFFLNVEFSPDGKMVSYTLDDGSIKMQELKKGGVTIVLRGHSAAIMHLQYSSDGKKFVSASQDGTAKIWDAGTGALLLDLKGHNLFVESADFSPDGKKVVTRSLDFTAKVWNAETGDLLYTFIPVNENDYLVLDKYNHFDGTEGGRKALYFTCGTEVIELDQVKDQLWVPNLAERILNGETINAQKLSDLNICNLTPLVDTLGQTASQYRFRITPRMGGLGVSLLYVNGIEVRRYNPAELSRQGPAYMLTVNKKELQKFFVSGKENDVTIKALTAGNSISSRSVSIVEKSNEQLKALPNLYAIVVGISDYKGNELDLKYAAKDAMDMANTINMSAGKLLNTDGKEHVFVYKLHTGPGRDKFPEKNSIREAFVEIARKAGPNDILLIFFAGHGVLESAKNQFYFLTADASSATVFGALKNVGISTEELAEWIKPQVMKAQKRILIFDACNSGQAIKEMISLNSTGQNALAARGDDKAKQIKAVEKLNERAGVFILSASASDQRAYEIGKYNQGALTYSLLKAIKEEPDILENKQYLNVSRWFNAAEKTVSELARETGARQQPQQVSTTNFSVGIVDDEVRNNIVLPFEKMLFTRSDFRNVESRIDNLKMRGMVDQQLDNNAEGGMGSSILYSPEYDGVNVYALSGDYTVTGQQITVTVILTKGGTEIKTKFEVSGSLSDQEGISKKITAQAINWLNKNK